MPTHEKWFTCTANGYFDDVSFELESTGAFEEVIAKFWVAKRVP